MVKARYMHSDLISILWKLSIDSTFTLIKEHVKAHQDDLNRPLILKESLNCKMDNLAKSIDITHMVHTRPVYFTHTDLGLGTILCNGYWISSRLKSSLYKNITHHLHVDRLGYLLNLPHSILHNKVNWTFLTTSRKEASHQIKIFMTKWISGDTASSTMMVRRKQHLSVQCPL